MTGRAALRVQRLDLSSHACISCSIPAYLFTGPASPPAPNSWVSPVADTNALEGLVQLSEPRKRKGLPSPYLSHLSSLLTLEPGVASSLDD